MIWRLLARIAVPRKAIEGCWPRPAITLWYFNYIVQQAYGPGIAAGLYGEQTLLRRLRETS